MYGHQSRLQGNTLEPFLKNSRPQDIDFFRILERCKNEKFWYKDRQCRQKAALRQIDRLSRIALILYFYVMIFLNPGSSIKISESKNEKREKICFLLPGEVRANFYFCCKRILEKWKKIRARLRLRDHLRQEQDTPMYVHGNWQLKSQLQKMTKTKREKFSIF